MINPGLRPCQARLINSFKNVGRRIVDFAHCRRPKTDPRMTHCRRHFGNDAKLVCFDGEEGGKENIAPDTLVRLG